MKDENEKAGGRLKLVYSRGRDAISRANFVSSEAGPQASLFPLPKPGMVVFADFEALNEQGFIDLLFCAQPAYIFDMRVVPRFDLGSLNRRSAFGLFEKVGAVYVDATAPLMSRNEPGEVLRKIETVFRSANVDMQRPMIFLFEVGRMKATASEAEILSLLSASGKDVSEVLAVPSFQDR